jgi:hypothetical protein
MLVAPDTTLCVASLHAFVLLQTPLVIFVVGVGWSG